MKEIKKHNGTDFYVPLKTCERQNSNTSSPAPAMDQQWTDYKVLKV